MNSNFEPTKVTINGINFNIFAFGAIKSARISADLISMIGLVIAGIFANKDADINDESAVSSLTAAFGSINGNKVEKLIQDLILSNNVSVELNGTCEWLDKNTCDTIFMKRVTDMFRLVYEVIKLNFGDFFELFGNQSGDPQALLKKMTRTEG